MESAAILPASILVRVPERTAGQPNTCNSLVGLPSTHGDGRPNDRCFPTRSSAFTVLFRVCDFFLLSNINHLSTYSDRASIYHLILLSSPLLPPLNIVIVIKAGSSQKHVDCARSHHGRANTNSRPCFATPSSPRLSARLVCVHQTAASVPRATLTNPQTTAADEYSRHFT